MLLRPLSSEGLKRPRPFLEEFLSKYRQYVPFIKEDEVLHHDIEASIRFLKDYDVEIEELFLNTYGLDCY